MLPTALRQGLPRAEKDSDLYRPWSADRWNTPQPKAPGP